MLFAIRHYAYIDSGKVMIGKTCVRSRGVGKRTDVYKCASAGCKVHSSTVNHVVTSYYGSLVARDGAGGGRIYRERFTFVVVV
jgi:hypothetical protein